VTPSTRLGVAVATALALGAVLVSAGCGSSSKASSSDCKKVAVSIDNEVASFLQSGYTADGFRAVRSSSDGKMWLVSAHAVDPGGQVIYPTWATPDIGGGGLQGVDADSFRVTPRVPKLPAGSGLAKDDNLKASKDCARSAAGGGS
jgi:hypothetical protein